MASQTKDEDVFCEFCNKSFTESTLLRHIGKRSLASHFMVWDSMKWKRRREEKKSPNSDKKPSKSHNDQLKKRRKKYANNIGQKEKNRENLKNQGSK